MPGKFELIAAFLLLAVGLLILVYFPDFSATAWFLVAFSIVFFVFPGPQLRLKLHSKEVNLAWREKVKRASANGTDWWTSPFPWIFLTIVFLAFFV
ncbi:hypothetical protein GCM10009092_02620 [Bowmanella denitrificans]|uniref:Uncharacterized protein n=1 Tax=Bowmanella denitrificans TaxID=366582 RepID=A0ABN0WLY1_9ALTE